MDQINSSGPFNGGNNGESADKIASDMQQAIVEFLALNESQNRVKNLIGRGTRLNVSIDEVRQFNPRLANFIRQNPIKAIHNFEDQLNKNMKDLSEGSGKQNQEKQAVQN